MEATMPGEHYALAGDRPEPTSLQKMQTTTPESDNG